MSAPDDALAAAHMRVAQAQAEVEIEKQRTAQAVAQANAAQWRTGITSVVIALCAWLAYASAREVVWPISIIAGVFTAMYGLPELIVATLEALKRHRRETESRR